MPKYIIHIPEVQIVIDVIPDTDAAVAAVLQIGDVMPGQITVDTDNEAATIQFTDDHGDVVPAPDGTVATYSSDNTDVVTVEADPNNPLSVKVTPVAEGSANISVVISGSADPEGNAFVVDPVAVTVSPGPAAEASLVLSV